MSRISRNSSCTRRCGAAVGFLMSLVAVAAVAVRGEAATLVADYKFNNNLSSSVGGAPNLVFPSAAHPAATGGAFSNAMIASTSTNVYDVPANSGLQLDTSSLLPDETGTGGTNYRQSYTVAMLMKVIPGGDWSKLVTFREADNGIYRHQSESGAFLFAGDEGFTPFDADTYYQIVFTNDGVSTSSYLSAAGSSSATPEAFVPAHWTLTLSDVADGVYPADTIMFFTEEPMQTFPTGLDDSPAGSIDRIQIYRDALTDAEVGQLNLLEAAPAHAGDFNSDGAVDGADFVAWQTHFPTASGASLADGDANGDGAVDGADFVIWQTNFPFPTGPGAAPVPEP
ncbi:MAG: hypothetical protein IT427_06030, partial [Pirellulales bacterium]|nr:hypothetical protein [Pirellulales bacterium]